MSYRIPFLLLMVFTTTLLFSQENRFFMPWEFQEAYEDGTRSYDGKPGPNYWHNTVDYQIEVAVNPAEQLLEGSEKVVYYNNSPDELSYVILRLYGDVYNVNNTRDYSIAPDDLNEGVNVRKLVVDGREIDLEDRRQARRFGTNLRVSLEESLQPGESVDMEIDWAQQIPISNVRSGVLDSNTMFIAYFYPQVAVYDDLFGWDGLSYTFRTEFYNNLGNYDVKITVPETYTVWSTGVQQNEKEVLPEETYARLQQAKESDEVIQVIGAEDLEGGYQNLSGTWHFVADEVPDFAFGLSEDYAWDATSQIVDGERVLISSAYAAAEQDRYQELTAAVKEAMEFMSEVAPGIPYPYPRFNTVIGSRGGGMEYPMMANNSSPSIGTAVHELFHTYFPMYVRTNEKRFAWMDEGWADFITDWVMVRGFDESDEPLFTKQKNSLDGTIGSYRDIPLITSSQFTDNSNYGYTAYSLPAFIYAVLHDHLGDELFLKAYREYIRRWAKKSPTPYDFFYTFEDVSGQDLSWLWKPWFFEYGSVDVAVESYKKGKLVVENQGTRPVPLTIYIKYSDGTDETLLVKASEWYEEGLYKTKIPNYKEVVYLHVNRDVPDVADRNNLFPSLRELYKQFDISEEFSGTYSIADFGVDVNVTMENGALRIYGRQAGINALLLPQSNTVFQTMDGEVQLEFFENEGKVAGMNIQAFGYDLITAEKQ